MLVDVCWWMCVAGSVLVGSCEVVCVCFRIDLCVYMCKCVHICVMCMRLKVVVCMSIKTYTGVSVSG